MWVKASVFRSWAALAAMAVRFAKLTKAWQHLKLSKSRQNKGLPWLRWEEGDEREGEPGAQALTFNCQFVHLMFEHLQQLTLVSIDLLQKAATCWHYIEVSQYWCLSLAHIRS